MPNGNPFLRRPQGPQREASPIITPKEVASRLFLSEPAPDAPLEVQLEHFKSKDAEREVLLEKILKEREQMKEALGDAVEKVSTLSIELEKTREANIALMTPPLGFAVVARVDAEESTADVISDGHRHRVGIHPSVDVHALQIGQRVVLNGKTLAIHHVADIECTGTHAQLSEWLTDGTALVEDSRGDKRVALVGDGFEPETLQPGTNVLIQESIIVGRIGGESALGGATRFLLAEEPDVTFDDIGGLDDEIAQIVASLENPHLVPELFAALHKQPTFSAVFIGLPGNGKTMLAKAIAQRQFALHREKVLKYAKGNFFVVNGAEFHDKWLGNSEKFMRDVHGAAEKLFQLTGAVSTIFFDDCETLFLSRDAGVSTNINSSMVTQFSTIVDGVRSFKGVNLIAATNRVDLMDPAVLRRFDRELRIKTPNTIERAEAIFQKHLRDIPFAGITTQEATDRLLGEIFAPTSNNEIVEIFFEDPHEDSLRVRLNDLISGKFLKDIVESAKDRVIAREAKKPKEERVVAITYEDLAQSLQSGLRDKESLPVTKAAIKSWLHQRNDKREIDYVENLRQKRKSDARHNRAIDEKVV